jgi:hypothetical protein
MYICWWGWENGGDTIGWDGKGVIRMDGMVGRDG